MMSKIHDIVLLSDSCSENVQQLVRMVDITKQFPGVLANDKVCFDLRAGEVHALLGENGAGKTTLMNILYGLYHPDSGTIYVQGRKVSFRSSADAIECGIGMVHQSFRHASNLTVVENLILGLPTDGLLLDISATSRRVIELGERYGLEINPLERMWQLSAGQQQRVEILKALYRNVNILILDEPTSVLTPHETEGLFEFMEQMTREGFGVIFISHKLDEVLRVSSRISVLRDGKLIAVIDTADVNRMELARLMVGREVIFRLDKTSIEPGLELLRVDGLCADRDTGMPALRNVSLSVRRGEILGIAGVAGNGQSELAEVLAGLRPVTAGEINLNGSAITMLQAHEIIRRGVAFIPDKPREVAILPSFSIQENTALKVHDQPAFRYGPFLNEACIGARAEALIKAFDIRTPSALVSAKKLSGGNIHKLVLACELGRDPDLIIASNPTAGLDVGATEYIRRRLLDERERGKGILLISSDLEEIMLLSDRIAVMFEGRIMGVVRPEEATAEMVGLLMGGLRIIDESCILEVTNGKPNADHAWAPHESLIYEKPSGAFSLRKILNREQMLNLLTDRSGWANLGSLFGSIVAALLVVGCILAIMGVNPLVAYQALWRSAVGTRNGIGEIIVRSTPLMLAGLAIVIAFRCGVWNIGAEGQIYIGALGATLVGLVRTSFLPGFHLLLVILAGFLFGALYGAIPGILRAYRGANEIITTIMLNYVAIFFIGFLVSWPMRDPNLLLPMPQSPPLAASARLPRIMAGTRAHAGIFLSLLVALVVWILLWKTVLGYRLRAVGENPKAAQFGGINVPRYRMLAMVISGGLAGLAGMGEVAGLRGFLNDTFSPGYGFTAIAVALLGGLQPAGVILSAIFFGFLISGAEGLQRKLGVPSATVLIIEGMVLVFVIARRLLMRGK